jgi:hypothetical protein
MSKHIVRRLIVVLALSAFLGSPATSLAGPRSSAAAARHARAQTAPQDLLSRVWNSLVRAWEKNGCELDPYGRCLPASQTSTDNGCLIDPNGRCITGQ